MSENGMQNKSRAPLIATIIVAVLAAAAVVVLIFVLNMPEQTEDPSDLENGDSGFTVTAELERECSYAVHDLISQSYEVMRLFVFDGLSYESEPYDNETEDGLYTVSVGDNSKYTSLEDIEELVRSVYTSDAADKVLHNIDGNGLAVYQTRKPAYSDEEVLGISADFKPDNSRKALWANCNYLIFPTSEERCEITVYLGGVENKEELSAVDESMIAELEMVKTEDGWRFSEFVY